MSKSRRRPFQLAPWSSSLIGNFDWTGLGDDPLGDMKVFAGSTNSGELQQLLHAEVTIEVSAMLAAVQELDAFDVIELVRLRELPIVPVAALVHEHDGNGAAIDLVTLVCLARSARMVGRRPRSETEPHMVVSELHSRSKRLLRLATFMHTAAAHDADPLARLASEYQSFLVGVRKLQYDSVQEKADADIFDQPEIDALLLRCLGFTYGDFKAVRTGIQERYSRILTALRDDTGNLVIRCQAAGREPTAEELVGFRESMSAFMFLPGERAAFTAADVAQESGIDISRVDAVLDAFSLEFSEATDAALVVTAFLRGVNPLQKTCLVKDASGNYLMTGGQIGTDSFRIIAEAALKPDSKAWRRYDRIRAEVTERMALEAVGRVLKTPAAHANLKYLAPKEGAAPEVLNAACETPKATGNQTECDGLFLIDDVAICVEVKGRTIAEPARRGDRARLSTEIKAIFGDGARQARRLEDLILSNHGLWREDGSWLDLAGVREVRSIVAGLDFFGPLAVALGDLKRAGHLGDGSLPWIASLHDLEVISLVIDRPAEFLLYLRRRTDSGVATHFRGADELDLFMLFLDGGLYVEENPEEIRHLHPTAGPARELDRKRHLQDARPTVVGTHTDPLDAWMYRREGSSPYEIDKPAFNTHPAAQVIVDFLEDGRKPGWFRFGADLLGLAGTAQKKLGDHLRHLVEQTRSDNCWHSMVQGYAGMWGYPMLFAGSAPESHTRQESAQKLRSYMAAKKHQMGSDRSLGLLMNNSHEIVEVVYMNGPVGHNAELDALGEVIGLSSVSDSNRPIPPSARRPTRRLRGKSSGRGKR
jgi:hypothetical protein